jgi:hypothetical protein
MIEVENVCCKSHEFCRVKYCEPASEKLSTKSREGKIVYQGMRVGVQGKKTCIDGRCVMKKYGRIKTHVRVISSFQAFSNV